MTQRREDTPLGQMDPDPAACQARLEAAIKSLRPVLEAVRIAPSAHNTQPWRLVLASDDALHLELDPRRGLPGSDPAGEMLAYSLGCAVEAAATVADVEHERCPRTPAPGSSAGGVVHARWNEPAANAGLALLARRCTDRRPFERTPPAPRDLEPLVRAAARHGLGLALLDDRARIRRAGSLTAQGAAHCLGEPGYLEELLCWTHVVPGPSPAADDGFTPETLCLDPASRWLVLWLKRSAVLRRALSRLGLARVLGWQAAAGLRASGALALLVAPDASDWAQRVRAGRGLMSTWLAATRAGVGVQPVHFPLALDTARARIMELFGVAGTGHAVALLRLGRVQGPPVRARRRPLESLCVLPGWEEPT